MNFFKNSKKEEIIALFFLYFVFFVIGINSFQDFGISVDEWQLRLLGFVNLKYIMQIFFQDKIYELNTILEIPDLTEYLGTHGAIFALPMSFIEYYFEITDSRNYFLLRHYINHFIFLISNFYFFLLLKQRFNNFFWNTS